MARNSKGTVAIEDVNGRLRLRWRYKGRQETLAIGSARDKAVWKLAEKIKRQIELDILANNYDSTKERYGKERDRKTILELWDEFAAAKSMSDDTKYKCVRSHLRRWKETDIDRVGTVQAKELFEKIGGKASTQHLYRTLLAACWDWANIGSNPWRTVKLPKIEGYSPDPFDQDEINKILEQFKGNYYLNFVCGLLGTGCRPGELIAVTWGDIDWRNEELRINKSFDRHKRVIKSTKTGKSRAVPLSKTMMQFLATIQPAGASDSDLIFPAPRGGYISSNNFLRREWKPALAAAGVRHRPTYKNRHSVWSHAIALGMPIAEAAKYAGNRPETMMRHYLGSVSKSEMPDLLKGKSDDESTPLSD